MSRQIFKFVTANLKKPRQIKKSRQIQIKRLIKKPRQIEIPRQIGLDDDTEHFFLSKQPEYKIHSLEF